MTIPMNVGDLHINHKYLLKWCNLIADVRSNAEFLDYGFFILFPRSAFRIPHSSASEPILYLDPARLWHYY